jgi:hypothetical protein
MQKGARKGISHATGVPQQAYERSAQGDSQKSGRSGDHWNIVMTLCAPNGPQKKLMALWRLDVGLTV